MSLQLGPIDIRQSIVAFRVVRTSYQHWRRYVLKHLNAAVALRCYSCVDVECTEGPVVSFLVTHFPRNRCRY